MIDNVVPKSSEHEEYDKEKIIYRFSDIKGVKIEIKYNKMHVDANNEEEYKCWIYIRDTITSASI